MSEPGKPETPRSLQPIREQVEMLRRELTEAQAMLIEAESDLVREQAAINAFRMHCRLKLDTWIDELLTLQTRKQALLTQARLLRQEMTEEEDDPFWADVELDDGEAPEDLILPTDVPRDKAAEKRLYRELARRFHPDLGAAAVDVAYRTELMSAVNTAYEAGDVQTLYDLADELDPGRAAELAGIESTEVRALRRRIIRLNQRKRKAIRRLNALRRENTARLWNKARLLEQDETNWWEVVRRDIERTNARLAAEIRQLNEVIARSTTDASDQSFD